MTTKLSLSFIGVVVGLTLAVSLWLPDAKALAVPTSSCSSTSDCAQCCANNKDLCEHSAKSHHDSCLDSCGHVASGQERSACVEACNDTYHTLHKDCEAGFVDCIKSCP